MKDLRFSFQTTLEFSVPVTDHQFALRCTPLEDSVQTLLSGGVCSTPAFRQNPLTDGFGNIVLWGSVLEPHTSFQYGSSGVARIDLSDRRAPAPNPALLFGGGLTQPGKQLRQYYAGLPLRGKSPEEIAHLLCERIHDRLQYKPGATNMSTTAEAAMMGGKGVCQDFAHIYVALARLAGLPARYCQGVTIGEGATHAWAEVYYDGGWYGFDPTRGCLVDESYLRFATGRDAADCPVERGVFRGFAAQTQSVYMKVEEVS